MFLALLVLCSMAQDPVLTQEDIAVLEGLFKEGLFDPAAANATRMRGEVELRTCWGTRERVEVPGWLVPKTENQEARFILDTLQEVAPPRSARAISLLAECKRDLGSTLFPRIGSTILDYQSHRLVQAAWLHRLGQPDEAARLLRSALASQSPEQLLKLYRSSLSWKLFDYAVNAYMLREDGDAQSALKRLIRMDSPYQDQARGLMKELERRREAGRFGQPPKALPLDLRTWPMDGRIALLVGSLDEVDARQLGAPADPELDGQPILRELVACGEAAVPALLDCLEQDSRCTRTVTYFRQHMHGRDILSVREVASLTLIAILRLWIGTIRAELGYEKTPGDPEGAKAWGRYLRKVWDEAKDIPFPERMMATLRSPSASPLARLVAADNLASLDHEPSIVGGIVPMGRWRPREEPERKALHEKLAPFSGPTTAEAVLQAMDRHFEWLPEHNRRLAVESPRWVEDQYLRSLADLGDPRILPELNRRYQSSKETGARRRLAWAAFRLGDPEPIDRLARELAGGRLAFPANDRREVPGNMPGFFQPGFQELEACVETFQGARTQACEDALASLVRKDHPHHEWARDRLLRLDPDFWDGRTWFTHPFGFPILRQVLDDLSPTGARIVLDDGRVSYQFPDGTHMRELPEGLGKGDGLKKEAVERVCDLAAQQLNRLLPGTPVCHPLISDNDDRLTQMRAWMDRAERGFRRMEADELERLGISRDALRYVPRSK